MQHAEHYLQKEQARNQAYFLADAAAVSRVLPLKIKPDKEFTTTRWLEAFTPPSTNAEIVLAKPLEFKEWDGDVVNGPIGRPAGKIFVGPLLSQITRETQAENLNSLKDTFFTQWRYGDKTIGMPVIVDREGDEFELMMVRQRSKGKGEYEFVLVPPARYGDDLTLTEDLETVAGYESCIRPVIVETPNFVSQMVTDKDRVGRAIASVTGAADFWATRLHKNLTGDLKQSNLHQLCMFINERQRNMFGREPQLIPSQESK